MSVGQEIVFRIASTGKAARVTRYDGIGLKDGICSYNHIRYIYGGGREDKALEYCKKKARKIIEEELYGHDHQIRIVPLGERLAGGGFVVGCRSGDTEVQVQEKANGEREVEEGGG